MTKVNTHINRRSFFKVSTMAGGGMVLGFNWLTACKSDIPVEQVLEMPSSWTDINAFLKIGDNGVVTIMSPNPEIGQNVKTSMPMIVAEELDIPWKYVLVEQAPLNTDAFTRQVAGGSQSIRHGWEGLRKAGATARQMLVNAAAKQWEADAKDCIASDGVISHSDGRQIGYGGVATIASTMEVPEEVELKKIKDYKLIGTDRKNVDVQKIITGHPLFGLDTKREGMVYACVQRPPAFGQKIKSFDASKAKSVSGVDEVVKFKEKIAVLANSTWAAMKGKKALEVEYEKDTEAESTAEHDKKLKSLLDAKGGEVLRKDGNVSKAFAEADEVVERIYESPFLPHNCLEPMNFFADMKSDKVELYGPIQTPAWTRRRSAEILGRDESEIEVGMTRMGGGFGRRLYGDFSDEATEISSLAGKPIQLVFTREDDMQAGTYRPAIKYKIQASIKDNSITGYRLTEAAVNSNMYDLIPHFFPAGAIDNYEVVAHNLQSNITTGAWRAPYTNFLAFAEQSFFDELAEKMQKNPVGLRIELLGHAIAPAEKDEKIAYSPKRMQGVIQLVAEKANWGNAKEGVYQGISAYYSHNTHVAEIAEVILEGESPKVTKVYCAVDCGVVINPLAAKNQIEGGIVDGIGHAMYGDLTFDQGKPSAANFDKYRLIRNREAPSVDVFFVDNDIDPTGLGEPSLPPAGGAIANALYKALGARFYKQPFVKESELLG